MTDDTVPERIRRALLPCKLNAAIDRRQPKKNGRVSRPGRLRAGATVRGKPRTVAGDQSWR